MDDPSALDRSGTLIKTLIGPPFEWCFIPGGEVFLQDFSQEGGTSGGYCQLADFWMAKYPVTNAQYQVFIDDPEGFGNARWWEFSPQARQWHMDHPRPKPTAFTGPDLPRTRVSWFENMAFCAWLDAKVKLLDLQTMGVIRLPTEEEWQRAAVGDTGWLYPWGDTIDPRCANYASHHGQTTPVDQFVEGQSPYGVMDLCGNVWERCLTAWGKAEPDLSGYTYRIMRGGAWNVRSPENLSAVLRYGHPPRGQLNDAGFRFVYGNSVN